jgi:hypothetical protein
MDLLDEQWPALMERLQEAGAPYVPYTLKY